MATKSRSRGSSDILRFYEDTTQETVARFNPVQYQDDFLGAGKVTIPAAGSAAGGLDWVAKIVGAAPPTVAGIANAIGGQIACALTSTSQKQDAALYWGDQLGLDITKGLNFESRVNLSVLPSASGVQAVIGVMAPWIDGPNNNTCYCRVGFTASGAPRIQSFDGATTIDVAAPGVTAFGTTDWHIVRIDASVISDVKIFIDGVQVTTTGQINFAATGTLAVLQPYASVYKPSGTGVATLNVDYVKAWMNRQ